jgi:hypothetical protein
VAPLSKRNGLEVLRLSDTETFFVLSAAIAVAAVMAAAVVYIQAVRAGGPAGWRQLLRRFFPEDGPANPVTAAEAEVLHHKVVATAALVASAALLVALIGALRRRRAQPGIS